MVIPRECGVVKWPTFRSDIETQELVNDAKLNIYTTEKYVSKHNLLEFSYLQFVVYQ